MCASEKNGRDFDVSSSILCSSSGDGNWEWSLCSEEWDPDVEITSVKHEGGTTEGRKTEGGTTEGGNTGCCTGSQVLPQTHYSFSYSHHESLQI